MQVKLDETEHQSCCSWPRLCALLISYICSPWLYTHTVSCSCLKLRRECPLVLHSSGALVLLMGCAKVTLQGAPGDTRA